MKLSEVKSTLNNLEQIAFQLPSGELVPRHFHVTEVGKITKNFIDCGGTVRKEEVINFQLWNANDYDHRLNPGKLSSIIKLSEEILNLEDQEIEVEYQGDTIGKFGLEFDGKNFLLTSKFTDCLALSDCGIQRTKEVELASNSCTPGGGCC